MRKKDVPQDAGTLGPWHQVRYAVADDGSYELVPSAGWDVVDTANAEAWADIREQAEAALERVRKGESSPLAFHMVVRLMDDSILAGYAGLARWRVRRHLKPKVFAKLPQRILIKYAQALGLSPEELCRVPERVAPLPGEKDRE